MNRKLSTLLFGLSISFGALAGTLTPAQALQRLKAQGLMPTRSMSISESQLIYTAEDDRQEATMYVFGAKDNNGFFLLSADDAAAPLLGYSDSGQFSLENLPPQMKWWMEEYSRQISYARANNIPAYSTRSETDRKAVAPLLKTLWNQNAPYNNLTPLINEKHAPTGCVATALAQVMKYWGYPRKASGTGTATVSTSQEELSFNLAEENLAWSSMLDSYSSGAYSDEQAHAVAYLMKVAGYASKMQYGRDASSAFSYLAGKALINNFSYNPKMQYCNRDYFSAADWEELVYNEVASGRPVLYGGQSTSVGHEFVCDGYSGDGYFHFNWGWSGMSDGYFLLDSLNPDALGTGGGLGGGFNFGQDVLVGVQPEEADVVPSYLVQYGALSAVAFRSDVTITIRDDDGDISSWVNTGLSDVEVAIGVAIEKEDSSSVPTYVTISNGKVSKPELEEGDGSLGMSFYGLRGQISFTLPSTLKDGDYKVTVVTKNAAGGEWTPVLTLPQYYNFFYLNKSGTKVTVETRPNAEVTLLNSEVLTPLYYDNLAKMKIEATNYSDKDLTAGFYPKLYFGQTEAMEGDGIVVTIPAHSTVTEEFFTTFRITNGSAAPTEPTSYQLIWYDPISDSYYSESPGQVTMNMTAPTPQLSIDNFMIKGVTPELTEVDDYGQVNLFTVEGNEADFCFDVTNGSDFFGSSLYVLTFVVGNNRSQLSSICAPVVLSSGAPTASTHALADLSGLPESSLYLAVVYYLGSDSLVQIKSCAPLFYRIVESAGVEEISGENNGDVKYYNLQGIEVKNPAKGMLLIKKQGSRTQKILF